MPDSQGVFPETFNSDLSITPMLAAFFWGLLATSSLVLGAIISASFPLNRQAMGIILGFGAGTLISAISYELIYESVSMARLSGFPALGFFAGAFTFFFADKLITGLGASDRMTLEAPTKSSLVIPMVLAIILDGIPESTVIGLGLFEEGSVGMAMLVAVFISNLPESIAGSTGMKESGWSQRKIMLLWLVIALVCALSTVAGYSLLSTASDRSLAFVQAFAGGAILMMLANSMIPEAYEHGGKMAGVSTVLGFSVSVSIVILENS